ncbi:TPA: DUF1311 domain-containing protein [Pseudomonas aeruginosa]|uniref:DUF1311 domain-containing protein n=2 Tax=Pseudomonas aeruginosa group TaxID=136841 RepID=A0ABD7K8J6_PSEAI|nr:MULTISPECIES: lysozyme inhibitor LprI family protein [Pseudomonas aeruginosa group]MBH8713209.1 DUF1311 domain-containing protein [Pseudomonas aeruginosa]MBH9341090.1 DUF1311 domain-containing protein [Pseudomonas aeruginosa]MBH9395578.1 DUF1311 domain-containing protein [Pseudomonas aeruginosa]MBI8113942.1 DUF1311 domain-containing protein [Pseudomonas aeruginosa]MCW8360934.1 DUF1311 domain-containing protein [Pseudomonas aeruginosa]
MKITRTSKGLISSITSSAVFFLLTASNPANSEPITHPYTETYRKCINDSTNTVEQYSCIEEEHKIWDQKLNKAYKETLSSRVNPPAWKIAQRNWLKFRKSQCEIYNFKSNGSGDGVLEAVCELNLTIERTLQLEDSNWPS